MSKRILVIEDTEDNRRILRDLLTRAGFELIEAVDGENGVAMATSHRPDLILMDIQLPVFDGYEATRRIRANPDTRAIPIIAVTSYALSGDESKALAAGCDGYVAKPFSIQELMARVRAHLRRAPERTTAAIEVGDFVVDAAAHTITVLGKPVHLTPKEFDLLLHLARNAGKVMTHRALLTAVWGGQSAHQPEYLRVFVGQLRKKLENETGRQYIQTEPWVGYRFVPEGWVGNAE